MNVGYWFPGGVILTLVTLLIVGGVRYLAKHVKPSERRMIAVLLMWLVLGVAAFLTVSLGYTLILALLEQGGIIQPFTGHIRKVTT